jgi:hypothetical protein
LRDVEARRGAVEAAVFGNTNEIAEGTKFHKKNCEFRDR